MVALTTMWVRFRKWIGLAPKIEANAKIEQQSDVAGSFLMPRPGGGWTAPLPPTQSMDEIREVVGVIKGNIFVVNDSKNDVKLEGAVIKNLFVRAGARIRVHSPVTERVHGSPFDTRTQFRVREWDAQRVVQDMINQYCAGIAIDRMTTAEVKTVTLPVPRRMFPRIEEEVGLRIEPVEK